MRRLKIFWLLLVFILFILPVKGFSEEKEKKHPIDVWVDKCFDEAPQEYSLAQDLAILKCLAQAYEMWDKELNKVYRELMQQLNDEEKKLLRDSQRKWLAYRDAESKFIDAWQNLPGFDASFLRYTRKIEIIRSRVLQLELYLSKDK